MNYYVIHKNPVFSSGEWVVDGPFDRKYHAEGHALRCEYAAMNIEHRIVNEDELAEELGPIPNNDEEE